MRTRLILWIFATFATINGLSQSAPTDHYFESDGFKLRYIDEGAGEPVLLIHGFTVTLEMWVHTGISAALQKAGYRVIAYDLRGHGRSDKPHGADQYGMPSVEDIVHLLAHLEIRRAHLVGYSRGGLIANGFLNRHPDRIRSVTFGGYGNDGQTSGPVASMDRTKVAAAIAQGDFGPFMRGRSPLDQPDPSPEQIATINKMIFERNDPKSLAASFLGDGTVPTLTRAQLETNTVPVLALIGENDYFKVEVDKMASVMNNLEVLIIPKADHMQAAGRPEFITGLLGFLIKHGE